MESINYGNEFELYDYNEWNKQCLGQGGLNELRNEFLKSFIIHYNNGNKLEFDN